MKRKRLKDFTKYNWVEIDLGALASNYRRIKKIAGEKKKIMAVVKADAYGHGMVAVSRKLSSLGVDYLAVVSIEEAVSLRRAGITKPILLLNVVLDGQIEYLVKFNITATVAGLKHAQVLSQKVRRLRKYLKVHIEIDTGMGRCGIWHEQAVQEAEKIVALPYLDTEGVYSHFSSADTDKRFSKQQVINFKNFLNSLEERGITFKLVHIANSAGIVNNLGLEFNMARPGLILYGLSWQEGLIAKLGLKPVMSFKARIVFLKTIEAGRPISYGRTFIAHKKSLIATLGVGYADGYNRLLSNQAQVLVNARRANVVGRVCMDHIMVDVTNAGKVKVGDEVILLGAKGKNEICAQGLARLSKTISYEVVCSLSKRADRIYK